ncbi:nitroreductase family protein [Secundilactobacillus similis]|uniref:nitroreductase family protein n=1 Tax=Secundilactobacillus similis TaxID=414682 RepID=UPI0006D0CBE6|nr:nitroreductase family protein [Secundilactobacillus similis]
MAIVETDFQKILTSRHATRQFDTSVTISRTEMLQMLDEAMTAPSALNRQPWRVVVIDSDDARKTLKPLMGTNGTQNPTASASFYSWQISRQVNTSVPFLTLPFLQIK